MRQPQLIEATLDQYDLFEELAETYPYEIYRACGFSIPEKEAENAEGFNFKRYFEEENRHAFFIKDREDWVGFALIHREGTTDQIDWCVGEFFVLSEFQRQSIGKVMALEILSQFPGYWEISVIPENRRALNFWRKVISEFTKDQFSEDIKQVNFITHQDKRLIFQFRSY